MWYILGDASLAYDACHNSCAKRGSELNVIECSLNILRTTGETRSDVLMKTKHDVKNLIQYPANVTVIYLKFQ